VGVVVLKSHLGGLGMLVSPKGRKILPTKPKNIFFEKKKKTLTKIVSVIGRVFIQSLWEEGRKSERRRHSLKESKL